MANPPHRRVQQAMLSEDVRRGAITWLSNNGMSSVLWDTCQPVWDSADLLAGPSGPDQMAVFGVEGVLMTPYLTPFGVQNNGYYRFLLRYIIDYSAQPRYQYRVYASVVGPIGHPNETIGELHLFQENRFPGANGQREYIEGAIRVLTHSIDMFGFPAAVRLFLS